jgi:hypothetical protein
VSERDVIPEQTRRTDSGAQQPQGGSFARLLRDPRVGPGAIVAVAALIGFGAWIAIESRGGSSSKPAQTNSPAAFSASGLKTQAGALGQVVYWVGTEANSTYELTKTATGFFVRYLPAGVNAGDPRPFLTVGTYPLKNAYNVMKATPKRADSVAFDVPGGGIAILNETRPTSVYVAYPKSNYQIELYDPNPATARQLAMSGTVQTVLGTPPVPVSQARGPVAATPDDLRTLAASLGHPVYWAGPRPNTTLELTQTTSGRTYVRYLPAGVAVGAKQAYLTIATYPLANAFAVTRRASKGSGAVTIKLPNNGIAVYAKGHGRNVHLAFQGAEAQVEVYDPSPSVPPKLVASGQVVAV